MDFQNIQILSNSPTQDGNDALLSFFVDLPDGTTMPSELLSSIYMSASPPVITQHNNTLNTTSSQFENPTLTPDQEANLVELTIVGGSPNTLVCPCFLKLIK